ncbi:SGNH/GDSL hydrolase family protein [Oceanobacillus kimchii]|uniref:SGNH/GDSL hydrolase family protein n=1 Tax=Oceanobacillus kimchii TaxID=746691 RepID=UPI00034D6D2A|nr:SGNH/GDSL hydrolase family protein [Oceanobacillus kimchii]
MKNKKKIMIYSGLVALVLLIIIGFIYQSQDPFKHLSSDQIEKETALQKQVDQNKSNNQQDNTNDETANENAEAEETSGNSFPKVINEAVQGTMNFLSTDETQIVAVGDSLTQGVGDETEQGGYVGILDRTINSTGYSAEFDNFGKRGNRTDQLLERLRNEQNLIDAIQESDIALVTIGANDIMQVVKENITSLDINDFQVEQVHYEQRLQDIFTEIREINPDSYIYLVGIYNPFKNYFEDIQELDMIVSDWNDTGISITDEYENSTFIPIEDLFNDTNNINLYADDNFHPNYEGYYRIAERVLNYMSIR